MWRKFLHAQAFCNGDYSVKDPQEVCVRDFLNGDNATKTQVKAFRRLASDDNDGSILYACLIIVLVHNEGLTCCVVLSSTPRIAFNRLKGIWSLGIPHSFRGYLRKHIPRIPIFGQGLNESGKALLYRIMWAPESPFTITSMRRERYILDNLFTFELSTDLFPGVEGVGSGIGVKINKKEINFSAFYQVCTLMSKVVSVVFLLQSPCSLPTPENNLKHQIC